MTAATRPRRPPLPPPPAPPARSGRLRRGLRVLVALLPLAALGWVLLGSSLLAVDRVEVSGTARLATDEVRQVAGVRAGTPLARVDTEQVARRLRALPAVAGVTVTRGWPDRLDVAVSERVPVVGHAVPEGVRLLDATGTAFAVEPALPAGTVGLEVPSPGPDDPATRAALRVLAELPPDLRGTLTGLRATGPADVVLLLAGDRRVVWGAPGDAATKGPAATALLRLPGTEVDVATPGVAVRR